MKTEMIVEVVTATQCSFIPFTPVPDEWKGMKVRLVVFDPSADNSDEDGEFKLT